MLFRETCSFSKYFLNENDNMYWYFFILSVFHLSFIICYVCYDVGKVCKKDQSQNQQKLS